MVDPGDPPEGAAGRPPNVEPPAGEVDERHIAQEIRRSNVRVYVTYGVTLAYIIAALGLIFWLLWKGRVDLALGVFSGLSAVATGVIGFWFGNRNRQRPPPEPG